MKTISLSALALTLAVPALADDAPDFFSQTYPEHALDSAMQWYGNLGNEDAALDARTRELIMLGVAAQIPCDYCVHAHARNVRASGASEAEIREAVAAAAAVRMWSTVLNGMAYDYDAFVEEFDALRPMPGK